MSGQSILIYGDIAPRIKLLHNAEFPGILRGSSAKADWRIMSLILSVGPGPTTLALFREYGPASPFLSCSAFVVTQQAVSYRAFRRPIVLNLVLCGWGSYYCLFYT